MRPYGREQLESLYFEYPKFRAPKFNKNKEEAVDVTIVGAGPIGLTAALTLAKYGVSSVILEAKDTFNDGSRAICIARQSFHIFDTLGVINQFTKKALGWTKGRSFYRGKQILEFDMPDSKNQKYRPMYNLEQQYIEKFLHDEAIKQPNIDIRWQSRVENINVHKDHAILEINDPSQNYKLKTKWVLAADGANSTIRNSMNLRLNGENFEGRYIIADVQMKHDYPTIRRALFDPDCRRGGTVLIHKQPDDIWRIDYQITNDEDPLEAVKESTVRERVSAVLLDIGYTGKWELEWWSNYSANTLALDSYQHGPVFFIGDSAHIVPIFGVRGLNNGLADAQNISWKLAFLLKGKATKELLNSYTTERRGATLDVFSNAIKSTRFMTPPSYGWLTMRDAALSLALRYKFAGELANPRQMEPYTYVNSQITMKDDQRFKLGPKPGAVVENFLTGNNFLSDNLDTKFNVIWFGKKPPKYNEELNLNIIYIDPESEISKHYGAIDGSAYLIRPDMHIVGRWYQAELKSILSTYQKILNGERL